ncbi:MAG: phytanoyl-CoA dioxygenase, partial [Gemmatimonadetes bacterium]|nr:phytanoyl-CoA dioxygenase [Gemmatimonadota bacterium]
HTHTHSPSTAALVTALSDEDRYARANAVEALKRIGSNEAMKALLRDLATSRWCPQTNHESTF